MTVHVVYPANESIKTPFAIGRELSRRLEQHYPVQLHDHRARYAITPQYGDVLLGHPTWEPDHVFNASVVLPGWQRKLCLHPFAPGDARQVAHLDAILPHCDLFLAISGPYWMAQLPMTVCRHFAPKVVHVDLAVNRAHFPPIKKTFNPPGARKFLYIGNHPWYKNIAYLNDLAARLPRYDFAWVGSRKKRFNHLRQLGKHDFADAQAQALAAEFDFLITTSRADANPTTILEAMSWGLIPVCTPQSGYEGVDGMVNIPLDDLEAAGQKISELQDAPEPTLVAWQRANWEKLDQHYNWDRFAAQVMAAIASSASPAMLAKRPRDAVTLAVNRFISPNASWRSLRLGRLNHKGDFKNSMKG